MRRQRILSRKPLAVVSKMLVTVAEVKHSLRLETDEDDDLIEDLIATSEKLVMDILRITETEDLTCVSAAKVAALYAAGYLYENRTEANHNRLNLTLRALLFGDRGDVF